MQYSLSMTGITSIKSTIKAKATTTTAIRTVGKMRLMLFIGFVVIMSLSQLRGVNGAAVMSVDLGTEWMKVGVISPGVPMEIALNRESKRKTPALLAFRDGIRTFGEDAATIGIRDPASAYGYLLDLLGKTIDNPIVDLYRKRFPYYNIIGDPIRNTVVFKKNDDEEFSVEELIAQILVKAKEFAQESTKQTINECVLIVPGYFGQAEREALLNAAQLANLKVLQLMNDYTAVALNYAVFHRAEINETAHNIIFYDMGAYKTSVAVVSYQLIKDKQTKEMNPLVQVIGMGYDRTLGGLDIQLRLRDYLAAEFNAMKKTKNDVTKSPRAMAKLFKEAGRVKNVLSANNDHYAQIENLIDDQDFKVQVTRDKLEELCADLWPRVIEPLQQALKSAGLPTKGQTPQIIIFGGGTRVPKVQEIIKSAIQQELGKSLNADEAATMGAVYKAADLATGFKVKKFIIKDAVILPIHATFERDTGDGGVTKLIKRSLFGHMNVYPNKKVLTFNKHTNDFYFNINYGDLNNLSETEISYLGNLNLLNVELKKVKEILEKNAKDNFDVKGMKTYFNYDDSGIFHCTGIEYVIEKLKVEEEEGTLAKLGNTFSKLFSKDTEKKEEKPEETEQTSEETQQQSADSETDKKESENEINENLNKTETTTTTAGNKTEELAKNTTAKIVTVKEPVEHKITILYTPPLNDDAFEKSQNKLDAINSAEMKRGRLESSFNALESHVIETQQKLQEDEYANFATEDEKKKIIEECAAISNWLYDDIENPTYDLYEKRLDDLKKLTNVFMSRYWEHHERPEILEALNNLIGNAGKFLNSIQMLNVEEKIDIFTQVELDVLAKAINDTIVWRDIEVEAQNKLKLYEDTRLTVKDISEKISFLDREAKYLNNKWKIWKAKALKNEKKDAKKSSNKTTSANETENAQNETNTTTINEDIDIDEAQETEKETNQNEIPIQTEPIEDANEEANADADATTETTDSTDSTPRSDL